ncbi:Secreted RxLR effector protein 161, partial [Cucurbita argyrosperma subsp. sororia]
MASTNAFHCVIKQVCLFMSSSTSVHWAAVKQILRYLHDTIDMGLCITESSTDLLNVFSNADWVGNPYDPRSTGG